jgi:hypothetical protein
MSKGRRQTAKGHPRELSRVHRVMRLLRPRVSERNLFVPPGANRLRPSRFGYTVRTHRDAPLTQRGRMLWRMAWVLTGLLAIVVIAASR